MRQIQLKQKEKKKKEDKKKCEKRLIQTIKQQNKSTKQKIGGWDNII